MAPTAIVIGHSFVKRYAQWIGTHHEGAPRNRNEVCPLLDDLQLLGFSGQQSPSLHDNDIVFQATKFDIVVVDCGTNDIANGRKVPEICNNVLLFARRCLEAGSSVVVIMSVLPRQRRIQGQPEEFLEESQKMNDHMKSVCTREKQIYFLRITGFTHQEDGLNKQQISTWSDDGIHPSPRRRHPQVPSGMEKYHHRAIKCALHRAVSLYKKLKSGFDTFTYAKSIYSSLQFAH
jgi:hypothetical protein